MDFSLGNCVSVHKIAACLPTNACACRFGATRSLFSDGDAR